jgi:hypothetical protein
LLDGICEILTWGGEYREARDAAETPYTELVTDTLGRALGRLEKIEPKLADRVVGLLSSTEAASLRRVVLAPETCCRLLSGHPGRCDDREFWHFLTDAIELELVRISRASDPAHTAAVSLASHKDRWSALGDFHVDGEKGRIVQQPSIARLVVDTDSPAATCFDPDLNYVGMRLRHYGNLAEKAKALSKLEAAMFALDGVSSAIASFVRRFTLVANIIVDENSGFSSGSTDQYIGRSIFWNPHLPSVDIGALAEALVHEAIHALLSMHQVCDPWLSNELSFSDVAVIESPWTGAQLRLEPYLQACFVWFGLSHFWDVAERSRVFTARRAAVGAATARQGFYKRSLLAGISEYLPYIAPTVIALLREMQAGILSRRRPDDEAWATAGLY